MLDVNALDTRAAAERGYAMEVMHPVTGKPLGATVNVLGEDAGPVGEYRHRRRLERMEREQAATIGGKPAPIDPAEIDAQLVEAAVVRTIGWSGLVENGVDIPFSPEAARRVYAKLNWLRDAVLEASGQLGNFMRS